MTTGPARRLGEDGLATLATALGDRVILARDRAKIIAVPARECLWWTGAASGRSERERTDGGGHGRFWHSHGRVIIAHRFAFAVMHGIEALDQARLIGHRCDNPLCQRIAPNHVVVSSARANVASGRSGAGHTQRTRSCGWRDRQVATLTGLGVGAVGVLGAQGVQRRRDAGQGYIQVDAGRRGCPAT